MARSYTGLEGVTAAFELVKRLGKGSQGKVFLVRPRKSEKTDKLALKLGYDKASQAFFKELEILSALPSHPHVIRLHDWFRIESPPRPFVGGALFPVAKGNLADAVYRRATSPRRNRRESVVPEPIVSRYLRQLFSALAHLHTHGITHRDVKTSNILLMTNEWTTPLVLADFGHATNSIHMRSCMGTAPYVAPEVARCSLVPKSQRVPYDHRCDVWSAGVVAIELLSGNPYLYGEEERQHVWQRHSSKERWQTYIQRISSCNTIPQILPDHDISETCRSFLRYVLAFDARQRPTAAECLSHPFLGGNSICTNEEQRPLEE